MKPLIDRLFSLILVLGFNVAYLKPVASETVLEEIQRTGLLKVGVRSDAIPFGYRDNEQELRGICLDFISLLREQLTKTIDREIILVKLFISTLYNRFEIVEDQIVHFECGPNTIREVEDYEVEFSESFFITGTKFFAKAEIADKLVNSDGSNLTIGLLRYTTTETFIKNKYPQAQFELFQGVKGTIRAMQAVQQGRIDAFANDGILLLGESVLLKSDNNPDLVIVPQIPLTCEKYGLILPKNDPSWRNFINLTIKSGEEVKLLKEWFSLVTEDLVRNEKACQEILPIIPQEK
jgi:polar amino acid transport system substrate-binding protein